MASWPLKRATFSFSLLFSLLCASVPLEAFGQVQVFDQADPKAPPLPHLEVSESFANRFTTTVPLKQCEYPRLWSDKTAPLIPIHILQETRREVRDNTSIDSVTRTRALLPTTQATRIFNRITEHYRTLGLVTPSALEVIESPSANAFIRTKTEVVLTQTLLARVSDESELAFILAHEAAHIALQHTRNGGIPAEVEADTLALKVVTALGFNPCSGSTVLERLGSPAQLTLVSIVPRLNALHDKTFDRCG